MQLATLCYIRKDNKTLMLHRVKKENDLHEGKWNGLGGKVENGESPEECAIREIKEESGLNAKSIRLTGLISAPDFAGKDKHWYIFVYVIEEFDGEIIDSPEGVLKWHETKEIENLNVWPSDKIFFPLLDDKEIFSIKVYYENGELVDHEMIIH